LLITLVAIFIPCSSVRGGALCAKGAAGIVPGTVGALEID
jgi:hypothetical protein